MSFAGISWGNAFGPLLALAGLALLLPVLTVPRSTRSQARLSIGMLVAAGLTFAAAGVLFALLYAGAGNGIGRSVLRPAALSAILWAPLLGLSWLVRAQGVERRRGEDMAREGKD